MRLIAAGVSHKTAPVEVRERLALTHDRLPEALAVLAPRVGESVILSTCNRTEIYAAADTFLSGRQALQRFFDNYFGVTSAELEPYLYALDHAEAAGHLFRVTSGLESMVLGEAEILGQVRDALGAAHGANTAGKLIGHLFHHALHTGKRARTETGVGRNALSVSHIAAAKASEVLGDLSRCSALVVSAGEVGEVATRILRSAGAGKIAVANRTRERARALAASLGGRGFGLDELPAALAECDLVVSATDSEGYVIHADDVRAALSRRAGRPLFLLDLAVPRDIDPAIGDLLGAHLSNIDDLESVAQDHLREREREVPGVEEIIREEIGNFEAWWRSLEAVPTIVDLRDKVEGLRQRELQRAFRRLPHLTEEDRLHIDAMTATLVNKILHDPLVQLKAEDAEAIDVVRNLFSLGERAARRRGNAERE